MFEHTLSLDSGARRPWTVFVGLSGQLLALGFAMLVPLVYTDSLPILRIGDLRILPPISRPAPPQNLSRVPPRTTPSRPMLLDPKVLYAYTRIPSTLPDIVDDPATAVEAAGNFVVGSLPSMHSVSSGLASIVTTLPLARPAPPAVTESVKAEKPVERIKVGGVVQAAKLIHRVIPAYPAIAKQAHVSGIVQLMAMIGKDGRVRQLDVVSGHPLLVGAAVDAVRQWVYRPTLLNGDPVEVVSPIEVRFTLGQ